MIGGDRTIVLVVVGMMGLGLSQAVSMGSGAGCWLLGLLVAGCWLSFVEKSYVIYNVKGNHIQIPCYLQCTSYINYEIK